MRRKLESTMNRLRLQTSKFYNSKINKTQGYCSINVLFSSSSSSSIGNSYSKILGRFLDEYVTKVEIEDPYVRSTHQVLITNC